MSVKAGSIAGVAVSRETSERLEIFCELVRQWTRAINLVATATVDDLWQRHIVDSAQIFPVAPSFRTWLDMGSGGGFPGLVVATLAAEHAPASTVALVESDRRKSAFLRTAARELDLPTTIHTERVEALPPAGADVVSARALAPLVNLIPHAARHMEPAGAAIFPKGRRVKEEIAEARKIWHFELEARPSITDPEASVLRIERIVRA